MVFHFANQYGNTKAVPTMLIAMHHSGTFYFFFAVLIVGMFFCWFFVPEISGRSIEGMEELFELPWYLIGRKGNKLAPDHSAVTHVHFDESGKGNALGGNLDIKQDDEFIENASSANGLMKNTQTNNTTTDISSENGSANVDLEKQANRV